MDELDRLVTLNFVADFILVPLHERENGEDGVVGGSRNWDRELIALIIEEIDEGCE